MVEMAKVPGEKNLADLMTKCMPTWKFRRVFNLIQDIQTRVLESDRLFASSFEDGWAAYFGLCMYCVCCCCCVLRTVMSCEITYLFHR